jgi:XTP/dITP diphosphohydrolase
MKLILASHNAHKIAEIQALFEGRQIEVLGLDVYPEIEEIPETGDTFEANALIKARAVYGRLGNIIIADDSGLSVDALGGAPGVHSKRWTPEESAQSNNTRLLRELEGRTMRSARYTCALALVTPLGERVCLASCEGVIGTEPIGSGGFGYDPLFWPAEHPGRTMAQLSATEKNRISHRGKAFARLPALFNELYGT